MVKYQIAGIEFVIFFISNLCTSHDGFFFFFCPSRALPGKLMANCCLDHPIARKAKFRQVLSGVAASIILLSQANLVSTFVVVFVLYQSAVITSEFLSKERE